MTPDRKGPDRRCDGVLEGRHNNNVVLWPGGEFDGYRTWMDRDKAILGDRKGFIRLAMSAGVPIVPFSTVGGHDTLFVLSTGRGLAKKSP